MPNVYTRTGDKGDTGLFGGSRVAKQSLRVEAYGTVDEANAALGKAKAGLADGPWRERVHAIQRRIFVLAAELASDAAGSEILDNTINADDIKDLEQLIDDCLAVTGPQREFVIPGRDDRSAAFHLARTIVRRAERRVLTLAENEPVRSEVIAYLNRLSDAVYALARLCETWYDLERIEQIVRDAVGRAFNKTEESQPAQSAGLDLTIAQQLAAAAEERARQLGVATVVAVVDEAGHLVLVHRMPGALLVSTDVAIDKAWTAAAFQTSTADLGTQAAPGGPLPGIGNVNQGRVVLFGGGEPIYCNGHLAGAVGISGGSVDQDIDIMTAALRALPKNTQQGMGN